MDQDFHYYGTYYAARVGGYEQNDATLIAKASNFIDFFSPANYGGYWDIVKADTKKSPEQEYSDTHIDYIEYPRYTYQGEINAGLFGPGGLWSAFHFPPGNYEDPPTANIPSKIQVHGKDVADLLPNHVIRDVNPDPSIEAQINSEIKMLLNRPLSPLSRELTVDTLACLNNSERLEKILRKAKGGPDLLKSRDKEDILKRFKLILLGARAHVIADTWAHQDWCSLNTVMGSYWDIDGSGDYAGQQQIEYKDNEQPWKKVWLSAVSQRLSGSSNQNLEASPSASYIGHGWMGHFPDYSFIQYRYKPCWNPKSAEPVVRDNPTVYSHAFLELCSLFSQARSKDSKFKPKDKEKELDAANKAISTPVDILVPENYPRVHSANKWREEMRNVNIVPPQDIIDTKIEPDKKAVLDGQIDYVKATLDPLGWSRYGTYVVDVASDLYLFHIAADYHFQFVKNWIVTHKIGPKELFGDDGWTEQQGPLSIEKFSDIESDPQLS